MKPWMRSKKLINRLSFMPASPIHIQPDGVALQTPIKISQDLNKSFSITPFGLNHPLPAQQGSYPSRKIQTLSMLAGGGHPQPLADASPTATQARMQGKTSLVLEDHRFFGAQVLKFFLKPSETAWPAPPELEDKHSLRASAGIPTDASNAELASPLALAQTAALGAPPPWAHPNEHGSNRTLPDFFLSERQVPSLCWTLIEPAGPIEIGAEAQLNRPDSWNESNDLNSCESTPRPRLSIPVFAPRLPTTRQQSLFRPKPQEWFGQKLKAALFWLRHALNSKWGFSWDHINMLNPYLSLYLCRLY
jgi:hypothetical protein